MKTADPSLKERVGRMYRQLLLLQRLFQLPRETEDAEWLGTGDETRDLALGSAIKELVDELAEHARILTSVPFPLSEWQPGDGPDDERWRALTEIERREVLSIVSGYENLISWSEDIARGSFETAGREPGIGSSTVQPLSKPLGAPLKLRDALEYLRAERARVGRFRQEMGFLERRRIAG